MRFLNALRHDARDEIRAEFEAHRAECIAMLVAQGIPPAAAADEADRRFGDRRRYIEQCAIEAPEERMREHLRSAVVAAVAGLVLVVAVFLAGGTSENPFRTTWCLHQVYGLPIALACGAWSAHVRLLAGRLAVSAVGIAALWTSLVLGVSDGFRALQLSANPPPDAFNDGGPMLGALFLGWLPASLVVVLSFLVARSVQRRAARRA